MSTNTLSTQSKYLFGYFLSWAIHAQNYHVADIPAGQLTYAIYAFAELNSGGTCVSIDASDDGAIFCTFGSSNSSIRMCRT
jgi:GH18 family chitinase